MNSDIIQTKHVEFVEDVCEYEYIYSKKILETFFTDTDDIDEVDNENIVNEDYKSETNKMQKNNVDNNAGLINSQKTVSEKKRGVGRPKKVVRNL